MVKNQILCKWATEGEQGAAKFDTVEDMFVHRMYNSFNYINMDKSESTKMPPYLPPELQILSFNYNKIFVLPPIPRTIHSIYGKNNRLVAFPDISSCYDLEDIDLSGNEIMELDTFMGPNIKTINLDFNRLHFVQYEKVPSGVKVSVSYNFLKFPPPESHRENFKFNHNDIPDRVYYQAVMSLGRIPAVIPTAISVPPPIPTAPQGEEPVPYPIDNRFTFEINQLPEAFRYLPPAHQEFVPVPLPIPHTIINGARRIAGTDSQSVHNSSVQQSTNKSLGYVINYLPKTSQPDDLITTVITAYKENKIKRSRMRRAVRHISNSWAESGIFVPPIRQWCRANDIHSGFGITYKTLLKQVWAIIQDHEHRDELINVLCQELDASASVCFTGRFTRTLNVLTGFIKEVQIGISSGEQMQNQITMAIKRWKDKLGENDFQVKAREEVKAILNECKVSEAEQEAWLDAIE
jgi:hypothetical protein